MKNIIIVGAGGFGKEVAHSLQSLDEFNVIGFADDTIDKDEKIIYDYYVKFSIDELINFNEELCLAIAISDPIERQQVYFKLSINPCFSFPNIIAKGVNIDTSVTLGQGNIIMHGTLMTCNILVGNFNFFNGSSGIGHDVIIGNFNTFGPRTFIAGSVLIGNECNFMLNSMVLSKVKVPDRVRLLLSSTIFKSPKKSGNYFGSPAMLVNY